MNEYRRPVLVMLLILLGVGFLIGLTWLNLQLTAGQQLEAPQRYGADFLPRWAGTRLFVVDGQNPYSNASSVEIQRLIHGRRAQAGEDQGYFLYPLYSFLVFLPFAAFKDYSFALALWLTTLQIAVIGLAAISLRLSRWRISGWMVTFFILFTAAWFHTINPVLQGDAAVLCAFFVAAALLAIRSENDVIAGILLVLSTIKPHMVAPLIIFILIWAISNQRTLLFWSFLGVLALLIGATSLLMPDWLIENFRQVVFFASEADMGTPARIFARWFPALGGYMGWVLTAIIVVILVGEWRAALGQEYDWFLWTANLTLVLTPLLGLHTSTDHYIAMLPALMMLLAAWDERWGLTGRVMIVLSALLLLVGLWVIVFSGNQDLLPPDANPRIFFFAPIYLAIGLYWVRWAVIRPPRLPIQNLSRLY